MKRYALALAALAILIVPAKAGYYIPDPEPQYEEPTIVVPVPRVRPRREIYPEEYDLRARCILHPQLPECYYHGPRRHRRGEDY